MPYELIWEPRGVYWKYSGKLTGAEIIEGSTAIYGDARFDDLDYKLVDFTEMESIDMHEDEVALIAFQHKAAEASNPYIKNAIVIKSGCDLGYTFAKFFENSSWDVEIFEDIEKANEWAGRQK